jgi:hypothetical protein
MSELSWSKQEIIDAVIAEYVPVNREDMSTFAWVVCTRAYQRITGDRTPGLEGRPPTPRETALGHRIVRVYEALRAGRDPNTAYDVPLRAEEVPSQLQ